MSQEIEKRKQIGTRIKERRRALRLSIDHIAEQMNVSRATIGHWETGARAMTAMSLGALASVLKTTIEYLLHGKQEPPPISEADRDFIAAYLNLPQNGRRALRAFYVAYLKEAATDERVGQFIQPAPDSSEARNG